jgi:diacylglycerol kinase family enzyme
MHLGWSYLASALKHPARHQAVREVRGETMCIDTRPRLRVSIDGELGPETPFEACVVPEAIRVAAPASPKG